MNVRQLQAELRKRGAKISGRKHELIERLQSYQKHNDFRPTPVDIPQAIFPNWPLEGFRQLTTEHRQLVPTITDAHMDGYFRYRLACDRLCTNDIKAITKGKLMFESNMTETCSSNTTHENGHVFFSALIRASMQKRVCYYTKLKVSDIGIINSDCECASGTGPHGTCKHIAALLLMLQCFKDTGELRLLRSCTDNLQTFHRPLSDYNGSPIKAEQLGGKRSASMDDPRPAQYRNASGYEDHVRNLVFNFCGGSNTDMPMRYLYSRASLSDAVKDHDYLKNKFTEYWVDQGVAVSMEDSINLEKRTRRQAQSEVWHIERQWRITASKFGAVCHATEKRNMESLCGDILNPPLLNTLPILHGRQFESAAVDLFSKKTQLTVHPSGLFVNPAWPFLGATPDGVIDADHIVEVKCPYIGRENKYIQPGKEFSFLKLIENKVCLNRSHSYYNQIQGQLAISDRKWCYFIVFTPCVNEQNLFVEKIGFDKFFWEQSMLPKLKAFYFNCFRKHVASFAKSLQ